MNESISKLAKSMNVTPSAVKALAQGIANSLNRDKMKSYFFEANKEFRKEVIEAYLDNESKKINQFQTKYITNPEAKKLFQLKVLNLLQKNKT